MYNGFRVLIPFSEMDVEIEHREMKPNAITRNRLFTTISNMLVPKSTSFYGCEHGRSARRRQPSTGDKALRRIFSCHRPEGQYIVYEGRRCTARVLPHIHIRVPVGLWAAGSSAGQGYPFGVCFGCYPELQGRRECAVYVTHMERDKRGEVTEMFVSMAQR